MTQAQALDILKMGHNVYLTGPAGSGKTHVLNLYIDYLKSHDVSVGITASTGIAATHMGGMTIHAWSGIGIHADLSDSEIRDILKKSHIKRKIENVKVLIIDEVSMLHHFRLDLVDEILRAGKKNDEPFGGIQVVLCGDFFQLPPVSRMGEPEAFFVYESNAWKEADFKVCYLEEQYRQTDDQATAVLNDIRANRVSDDTHTFLRACFLENKKEISVTEPTRLFTHNVDVDVVNSKELLKIKGKEAAFTMHTRGNETLVAILKKSCLAPEVLNLKVGAQVMFVKNNMEEGYANGSLGVVTSLDGPEVRLANNKVIKVKPESWRIEEEGRILAEITQVPLRLAWAITVHKSQGMSLDAVEVDLSKSFEKGMGYVALSRVRTLAGLTILGINELALEVHPAVLEFDERLKMDSYAVAETLDRVDVEKAQKAYLKSIAPEVKKKKTQSTYDMTRELLSDELSLVDIAARRGMTQETILTHIEALIEQDLIEIKDIEYFKKGIQKARFDKIMEALVEAHEEYGDWRLSPAKTILEKKKIRPNVSFREIQLVRLFAKYQ
ncbi:MAG: AAA family ATPase [Candidatus Pacebacteria bacterium]|nr:AAA family ATPase [Candidatus Paceibacterota bacterium]